MTYRPYIDGLRAIAVVAIITFHFAPTALPGGFLGVDIFFVISGFLITELLAQDSDLPWRRRLGYFYMRRARRILPALFVTAFLVAAFALWIYLPNALIGLGKYLLFTPLMAANAASALDGGYFVPGNSFVPLKHFWSLAVEEQFYVLYPVLFLVTCANHSPRRRLVTLATLAVVSLVICVRGELRHSNLTFYLMPARAWELMVGGLVAVSPLRWSASRATTEVVAYACVAVLLATLFLFNASTGFPHPYVLIPCAVTGLLLFIGRSHSPGALQLLSMRLLVFTGTISYSLYLWHAPILAFTQYYAIRKLSGAELLAVGVGVYPVAVLSWWLVEAPVRKKRILKSSRAFVVVALSCGLVVASIGAWFWLGDGLPWRFDPRVQILTQPDELPETAVPCMNLPLERIAAGDLCRFGPNHPGVRVAVLWGDSHALLLVPAFEQLGETNDVQIRFAGHSGCRPLSGRVAAPATDQEGCAAFNEAMHSAIRVIHPNVTILSGFWDADYAPAEDARAASPRNPARREEEWKRTIGEIAGAGSGLCVVLDVPRLPYMIPYALAMASRRGLDPTFAYVKRSDIVLRYEDFERSIRSLQAANILTAVDPKDALCSSDWCALESRGRSLYRDANHLSRVGAMQVMNTLEPCLRADSSSRKNDSSMRKMNTVSPQE